MPLNRSERQGLLAGMLGVVLALVVQCWLEPLSGWQFAVAGIVITFGGVAALRGFTRGFNCCVRGTEYDIPRGWCSAFARCFGTKYPEVD